MNNVKKILGTTTLTMLMLMPLSASADSAGFRSGTGIFVGENGIVRVIGAQVSSVSDNFINAFTTIGNIVMNWTVNASSTTKVRAGGMATSSMNLIHVGDTIAFSGTTTGTTSPFTVTARKIIDLTTLPFREHVTGTVSNVNATAQTFTVTSGNRTLIVQANASTTVSVDGTASTFAAIQNGQKVKVKGSLNTANTVLTATTIVVKTQSNNGNNDHDDDDRSKRDEAGRMHGKLFSDLRLDIRGHRKDD